MLSFLCCQSSSAPQQHDARLPLTRSALVNGSHRLRWCRSAVEQHLNAVTAPLSRLISLKTFDFRLKKIKQNSKKIKEKSNEFKHLHFVNISLITTPRVGAVFIVSTCFSRPSLPAVCKFRISNALLTPVGIYHLFRCKNVRIITQVRRKQGYKNSRVSLQKQQNRLISAPVFSKKIKEIKRIQTL